VSVAAAGKLMNMLSPHATLDRSPSTEMGVAGGREPAEWLGCAFGLRVAAPRPLETLNDCSAQTALRTVSWSPVAERAGLRDEWSNVGVARLVGSSAGEDRLMSVDVDADGAYLVEAPGYGAHVVSADGLRITSVLEHDAPWNWQRLFVAQALPLAATIRGLEPLHASAVNFGGEVIAISAPSGTGKTSIAMHLVARGAVLVTDDVLAVELTSSGVNVHPGARLLSAQSHELATIPADGRPRLGVVLDVGEKVYLRPLLDPEPRPLAALYLLTRQPEGDRPRIVEQAPANPRDLLAMTFFTYVTSRERLTRHLEFASRLAQQTRVFGVYVPRHVPAVQVASLVEEHASAELGPAGPTPV
jgi:hypothetical protein